MSLTSRLKTVLRGDVPISDLPLELVRRKRAASSRRSERIRINSLAEIPAKLAPGTASLSKDELLRRFRERMPMLFADGDLARAQRQSFNDDTAQLIRAADAIVNEGRWELAGFGVLAFDRENFWRCDPFSGSDWGLDYHADVVPYREGGPDIRVLWELNRFGHAVTLARAFAVTGDESYAETLLNQINDWVRQNPYGRGANWSCAMEVALRSINLLASLELIRSSTTLTGDTFSTILKLFDQHGRFVHDNNEFSYVATSNHYLSDVVGLFWIGTLLPELAHAREWKRFGLTEMLREMDKQVLNDGADFESSTGYHRFVTEMLLYSFLLAKRNGVGISRKYWDKLGDMLVYLNAIIRPDGRMPLIGDADGSQIVPLVKRDADDAAYLLAIGAVMFEEPALASTAGLTPEILWLFSEEGVHAFKTMKSTHAPLYSAAFPNAGAHVMRDQDLYLHFNTNDCGVNGRGSHAHNDALSIEVFAFRRAFIVDPGSYVYNLDRKERNMFRSTAYHSTVMIDGVEQNTIDTDLPFLIGNEAKPGVLEWETSHVRDKVVAEQYGFARLHRPVIHRRTVEFNKTDRYWVIEDSLRGEGKHGTCFIFHIAPGIEVSFPDQDVISLNDGPDHRLFIVAAGFNGQPTKTPAFASRNYGHKQESIILMWRHMGETPFAAKFVLVPSGPADISESRIELARQLADGPDV